MRKPATLDSTPDSIKDKNIGGKFWTNQSRLNKIIRTTLSMTPKTYIYHES